MNGLALALSAFLLLAAAGWSSAESSLNNLSAGKMSVSFNSKDGFSIRYNGVAITKESTFWVHDANWSKHYYGYPQGQIEVTTKEIPGGKEAIITHTSGSFQGQHRVTVTDNKASLEFRYKLTENADADMEYNLGYVSASPIMGCPFYAVMKDGDARGTVPMQATSPDMMASQLTPKPFKSLSIDSRIGKLTIDVTGDPDTLQMFDARKNRQPWAEHNPVFWLGILGRKLEVGKEYVQTVSFQVEPAETREKPINVGRGGTSFAEDVEDLRVPAAGSVMVIPQPKQMTVSEGDFPLNSGTKIVVANGATPEDYYGARQFAEEIKALYGLNIEVVTESKAPGKSGMILVGEAARNRKIAEVAKAESLSAPAKEEGYAIRSTPERVLVLGSDQRGSYWGMQTLRQIVKASSKGISIQGCQINDYPSLPFRGAHLFIGKDALPFHKKLYDRIFSRFKLNTLVLESEYLQWKCAPNLAVPFSMTQEDYRKDIQSAREHFLEVVPMVNSLGHSEWMFRSLLSKDKANFQNLDLAEDPEHPYAYCPSNPKSYDFIFKIYDEILDIVKPKYLHIGHDEVAMAGQFPHDEKCRQKSVGDLVVGDIKKLHDRLTKKGVRLMMWGDMFLGPGESPDACLAGSKEEAKRRRDMLPKDIIINDWHYAPADPDEFKSTAIFKQEGFQNLSCTWFTPGNIMNFSEAAKKMNGDGLLQTTWAGFDSNEGNLKASFDQFTAFILAAEYAWNGGGIALEDLPYRADEEFRHQWDMVPPDRTPRKGFTVDLGPFVNTTLADNLEQTGWMGFGPDSDLSTVPTGSARLKGDIYKLAPKNSDLSVIRLSSALDTGIAHPMSVDVPLARKANSLLFLQTCNWPESVGRVVGKYKITYTDDTVQEINLTYGDNIAAWTDRRTCTNATVVWSDRTKDGKRVSLRRLEWKNPFPEKTIAQVTLESANTEAGPCLLAISGVCAP